MREHSPGEVLKFMGGVFLFLVLWIAYGVALLVALIYLDYMPIFTEPPTYKWVLVYGTSAALAGLSLWGISRLIARRSGRRHQVTKTPAERIALSR